MLFISTLLVVNPTIKAEENIDNIVNASFEIEMESNTDFKINAYMDVLQAVAFGTTYDTAAVKSLTTSTNTDDIEALGVIKNYLHNSLLSQIESSFLNADISDLYKKPTFENNQFKEEYVVNLTSEFFGMDESVNAHDFINGVLDVGARLDYNFDLIALSGWNNTYMFELSKNIQYKRTNGAVNGNVITWLVRNGMGKDPDTEAELKVYSKNPTTTQPESEDIFLAFDLDARDEKTSLNSNILLKTINIEEYAILPDFISNLSYMPADGIRLLVDNGFISWDAFNETTVKPIEEKIKTNIETPLFNQTIQSASGWDKETTIDSLLAYEINNMNDDPPIKMILTDENIDLIIDEISSRALFGLVNSGASANVSKEDINFGDGLPNVGYPYNVTALLPEGITLEGKNEYVWNDTIDFSGDFNSENSPDYYKSEIGTIIEIDVQNTDLNLLSFFTGKTELSFGLKVTETKNYNVTSIPEEFNLPEKITLNFLNSDAFRLCIEEKVFSEEETNNFLKNNKDSFQNRMNKFILPGLGARFKTNKKMFESSLSWNGDISNMDEEKAVIVSSYAHSSYPISFDLSFLPPKVNIPNRAINLTGLSDQSVTYRMIFPQGISITANDELNKAIVDKTKDGRYYFEVTFDETEDNLTAEVSLKMTPSALFTVGLFMPCIISFFIAIILVIVIIMLRKKRKGKKAAIVLEDNLSDYEDEDYYVPPPPGSK